MTNREVLEFRLLGPLEARLSGVPIPLGGAKQRVVLATLLLRVGEVVSSDVLIDELWEDDPPASATHSLEVYVSRLRSLIHGHGPSLVRRGSGYVLALGDSVLDTQRFKALTDELVSARAQNDHERAYRTAAEADALWRGTVAADLPLGVRGRSDADRLEELRLRTVELRFDAELELGRHGEMVGELQAVVGLHPYRERLVEQLMLALSRSGRQKDALDAYEQARRRLDEIGLQPNAELRGLSGQIVRQDPALRWARPSGRRSEPHRGLRGTRRATRLVLAGAIMASTMALAANGSVLEPASTSNPSSPRVALVLPTRPLESAFEESLANNRMHGTASGFIETAARHGLDAEILAVDEVTPDAAEIDALVRQLETGHFDLVLLQGDRASAQILGRRLSGLPRTQFAFIDTSLGALSLEGSANATAVRFALEAPARLVGYASGLATPRGATTQERADAISVVAGRPDFETKRVISAFRQGVRRALPRLAVRVDYSMELTDPSACERLANDQIDAGSDVILVIAGRCGSGAAAVAHARGVWVAGEDEYGMSEQPWVLASMFKDFARAPRDVLDSFVAGTLPEGSDLELDLADKYAVGMTMSSAAPAAVQSKVVALCGQIRRGLAQVPTHIERPPV